MTIHFGQRVGKCDPSTELPRCAVIDPLQLDVVIVFFFTANIFIFLLFYFL